MQPAHADAARSLDAVARVLAEWTVETHAERDPTLASRYGASWRTAWAAEVRFRLAFLAESIAFALPEIFVRSMAWSDRAFAARGIDPNDLRTSLECMREVLIEKLPAALVGPAARTVDAGLATLLEASSAHASSSEPDVPGAPALRYLEAILEGRRRDAERTVLELAESGWSIAALHDEVLRPALVEVGRMWHAGEISIADEHFATATTESVMALLRARLPEPEPRGRCVVTTAAMGNLHGLAVRALADFFEIDGWTTVNLGADMPVDDVVRSLHDYGADLLAISASSFLHLRPIAALVDAVRADPDLAHVRIMVGGQPFTAVPDLWRRVGADAWAPSALEAVETANRLLDAQPSPGR